MIVDSRTFKNVHVLVVGDVMLDRYWIGEVERISPEAPVPIVLVGSERESPGGAANVAANVVALGAACSLLSAVGDDQAGRVLKRLIEKLGVKACLSIDGAAKTTVKLRILCKNQQLIRADFERPPTHEILYGCLQEYRRELPETSVVLLSDYGKGGLVHIREMIELAAHLNKPVIVDPKGSDFDRYAGATMLTPNMREFENAAGAVSDEYMLQSRAHQMINDLGLDWLLITRSEKGMTLYSKDGGVLHGAGSAREVYDVSGAGDTVISACASAFGAGLDQKSMLRFANAAAGIVVGKLGTATAGIDEVMRELRES